MSEAERNYRSLVEQLPLVMYVTRLDESSSCIYMSPQIEDLVGYTPLECMSDPEFFVKILHPDDRERTRAAHHEAYETGESFSIKYRMLAKDGRAVWVHDEITIAKDESGRPTHAQGFLVDVTPQKAAQEERERQHAELSALHETALLLIDELDPQKLLERIAGQAGELVGTETPTSICARTTSCKSPSAPAPSPGTSAGGWPRARVSPAVCGSRPSR